MEQKIFIQRLKIYVLGGIMKKLFLTLFCSTLLCFMISGCHGHITGYKLSMVSPMKNIEATFSDKYIDISFALVPSRKISSELIDGKYGRHYRYFNFILANKTNEVVVIDWNKISVTDSDGYSGNNVMHKGTEFNKCSGHKAVSIIPPGLSINDFIIPCFIFEGIMDKLAKDLLFLTAMTGQRHTVDSSTLWGIQSKALMLKLHPGKQPQIGLGVFIPLQIGTKNVNYNFTFSGTIYTEAGKYNHWF